MQFLRIIILPFLRLKRNDEYFASELVLHFIWTNYAEIPEFMEYKVEERQLNIAFLLYELRQVDLAHKKIRQFPLNGLFCRP